MNCCTEQRFWASRKLSMPLRWQTLQSGYSCLHPYEWIRSSTAHYCRSLFTIADQNGASNGNLAHTDQPSQLTLELPAFTIWGSNTGVGKTLVSAGLAMSASDSQVCTVTTYTTCSMRATNSGIPLQLLRAWVFAGTVALFKTCANWISRR